jgi:hypothetical protein
MGPNVQSFLEMAALSLRIRDSVDSGIRFWLYSVAFIKPLVIAPQSAADIDHRRLELGVSRCSNLMAGMQTNTRPAGRMICAETG